MEQHRCRPEQRQFPSESANGDRATTRLARATDQIHLLQQVFVGNLGKVSRHRRVMQGGELQAARYVTPPQDRNLAAAEPTPPIVEHGVAIGMVLGSNHL